MSFETHTTEEAAFLAAAREVRTEGGGDVFMHTDLGDAFTHHDDASVCECLPVRFVISPHSTEWDLIKQFRRTMQASG